MVHSSWLIPALVSCFLRVRATSAVEEDCRGQRWRSNAACAVEHAPGSALLPMERVLTAIPEKGSRLCLQKVLHSEQAEDVRFMKMLGSSIVARAGVPIAGITRSWSQGCRGGCTKRCQAGVDQTFCGVQCQEPS